MEISNQNKGRNAEVEKTEDAVTASDKSEDSTEQLTAAGIQASKMKQSDQEVTKTIPSSRAAEQAETLESTVAVESGEVKPSDCGCGTGGGESPSLVYALGQLGYDFGSEARLDSFAQHGISAPHDPFQLLEYLQENPSHATALTWTLSQETTPIYAIQPGGAFAAQVYDTLSECLKGQLNEGVERVSIPGIVMGKTTLLNGQVVPNIWPELRGMYSWSTPALVQAVVGKAPSEKKALARHNQKTEDIANFLERIYYEIRNLGITPQERAMNYAATNAFQLEHVYKSAIDADMKLDTIGVELSPICRPGSDCWDVKLTFFHPGKRLEQARIVFRFTVDVSDVVPVTVGKVRSWHVY